MDFGQGAVGVEVGKAFAEFGADVIKIETRTYPDFIRLQTGGWNTPSFTSSSRSKRALGVNFKFEEGRQVLLALAARSDVAVENNAAGVMDAGGLGFSALHAANPALTMFSSHLMGSTGPWADWRGYGPSTLAPSGVLNLWDYPDADRPTGCGTIFPDQFVGRLGAVAALAGVLGREHAGHDGRHIELAQVEGAAGIVADLLAAESLEPGSAKPLGSGHESAAPWGMYQCAGDDQWVAITCRGDADWAGPRRRHRPGRRIARRDVTEGAVRSARCGDRRVDGEARQARGRRPVPGPRGPRRRGDDRDRTVGRRPARRPRLPGRDRPARDRPDDPRGSGLPRPASPATADHAVAEARGAQPSRSPASSATTPRRSRR